MEFHSPTGLADSEFNEITCSRLARMQLIMGGSYLPLPWRFGPKP